MYRKQGKRKIQTVSAALLLALLFSYMGTLQEQIAGLYIPMLIYTEEREDDTSFAENFVTALFQRIPLYAYLEKQIRYRAIVEDETTYEQILKLEGMEEEGLNMQSKEIQSEAEQADESQEEETEEAKAEIEMKAETEIKEFVKADKKQKSYQMEELQDFETLLSKFYAIDSTTMIEEEQLNAEKMLAKDMKIKGGVENPQILIYHTHASENFVDSIPGDQSTTVVGAGEKLAKLLREDYGYNVIHDTGCYDKKRAQAYNVAAPNVEKILADNPSIEVIIDLHRDQMKEGVKLVQEMDGRPTAQFMFFNGLSRTKELGEIEYLKNPYIDDNLAFAFQMQMACNEYYPGITRRIYLKGYRYNMQYRDKTLLIELGAQTNTVQEIMNAIDPIAHALNIVLRGENS